ncbi:LacI family DNA-binding transcriptional regulator [Lactobacillus sp. YT155]|uniref:ribose utilization transcriptional repressor RbsR n=1 Tax=Lactobacillus sp. YT155 TaxID=3060955 RepID=UPI00265E570A|nr:LacI family DNA-binding transcriptional regulator [Lactobacillus sp. YT155]MDO1605185.1 LacI family DNA-binding transcriptional regulator [Lactobacillus sp. YT155]
MVKKSSIKDVAELAGISVTTVSLILNNKGDRFSKETISKVHAAQKELNYLPDYFAQGMTAKTTKTIGVLVPDINNPFFSKFTQGVEEVATDADFIPLIYNVGMNNKKVSYYLKELVRRTVDGFIIAAPNVAPDIIQKYLQVNQVPYITLDQSSVTSNEKNQIKAGDYEGGISATNYLLKHHHERIGIILPSEPANNIKERFNGYTDALLKAKITPRKEWIIKKELSKKGGYQAAAEVIRSGVTAVFAVNDEMAIGLYRGLKEYGKSIPEDISIIGYDNIDWCDYVQPRLTTIRQSIVEIGQVATELLLTQIQHPNVEQEVVNLSTNLIERESVRDIQEELNEKNSSN